MECKDNVALVDHSAFLHPFCLDYAGFERGHLHNHTSFDLSVEPHIVIERALADFFYNKCRTVGLIGFGATNTHCPCHRYGDKHTGADNPSIFFQEGVFLFYFSIHFSVRS